MEDEIEEYAWAKERLVVFIILDDDVASSWQA
jgi:hypothetical protein